MDLGTKIRKASDHGMHEEVQAVEAILEYQTLISGTTYNYLIERWPREQFECDPRQE